MGKDEEVQGKAKGGVARAKKMSPERRKKVAKQAAIARWGAKASHRGNFDAELGIDVDCYVLDDDRHTAVISQRGMGRALGLSDRGNAFPRFIGSQAMAPYVGAELQARIDKPIKFQSVNPGAQQPNPTVFGYDVTLLIDVCNAILVAFADGKLLSRHREMAKQAQIIVNASAKSGISQLVYDLAGFDTEAETRIAAFKMYVAQEAREYEREFPDELYREWYRLYGLEPPKRGRPWRFKHLTIDHVYKPLANSNGKILELTRTLKGSGEDRSKKLHQFLSEIGVKALRQQLGQLLGIAKLSTDSTEYESNFAKVFDDQRRLF